MAASIGNTVRSAVIFKYFKGFQQISASTTRYVVHTKKGGTDVCSTPSKYFHSSSTDDQNCGQLKAEERLWPWRVRKLGSTSSSAWLLSPAQSTNALVSQTLSCRRLSTGSGGLDAGQIKSKVDDIAEKFTEARDLLEDAREVKGTVYFSEDMKEAAEAVDETLKDYNSLLALLNETQKQDVLRTIGLKMEELKAQKNMLEEEMTHDE